VPRAARQPLIAALTVALLARDSSEQRHGGDPRHSEPATFRVVGRTDGNAKAPRFQWSGVHAVARFRGTGLSVDLIGGTDNHFEVVVDGVVKRTLSTDARRQVIPLAAGLPEGEHEVILWRRTEGNNGSVSQVFGVSVHDGALLPARAPRRRLEAIGDSITCGYGNEGEGPGCAFSYVTENHYLSYAAVAARELDAELFTVCWSGKGVSRNYDGDTRFTLPEVYGRALATSDAGRWDFSWLPDVIVVNLGTNDFAGGDPGSPFVDAYDRFVTELRGRAPHARVLLVIGPMLHEPALTKARAYLDEIVRRRRAAGDGRVEHVLVAPQDPADGLGCDHHPSTATHAKMGAAVARTIESRLGW